MVDFQKELLGDVATDCDRLLSLHYNELALHKEVVKLKVDWERYASLERLGKFHVFTARDNDSLIGYAAFLIDTHLHYKDLTVAVNDVLYLDPDRREGWEGIKLIKFSERECKDLGAQKIVWRCKTFKDLRPIMHRLGYVDEDISVGKIL